MWSLKKYRGFRKKQFFKSAVPVSTSRWQTTFTEITVNSLQAAIVSSFIKPVAQLTLLLNIQFSEIFKCWETDFFRWRLQDLLITIILVH